MLSDADFDVLFKGAWADAGDDVYRALAVLAYNTRTEVQKGQT